MTPRPPDDFKDELEAHLALEADALREEGVADADAPAAAQRALGNRTRIEERFHERRRWRVWDELRQDVHQAVRVLGRSPRFVAAVVATLALGVGANTALTGAIDEILWSPLDVPRGHELVAVHRVDRKSGAYLSTSYPDYDDLARRTTSLGGLAGYVRAPRQLDVGDERVTVGSEWVTTNYFDVLEVRPILGRAFETADNAGPGGRPVAMLSEALWTNRFGRDPGILGRPLLVDGEPFEIVGVVPATYGRAHNIGWGSPPEIWVPVATFARFVPGDRGEAILRGRGAGDELLLLLGRLSAGATPRQAQAEIETIVSALSREPGGRAGVGVEVLPAGQAKFYPGHRHTFGRQLALLGLAGALVLVLACANLANLLLERTTRRRRELAVRASLGAGRTRLVRQLLTESLVLVVPGFVVSLLVAYGLLRLLSVYPTALGVPLAPDLHVTSRVVLLCLLTSLGAVLAFSLVPILGATRSNLSAMASARDGVAAGAHRPALTHALVVAQFALSAVLLAGALLMVRAIAAVDDANLGVRTDRLLSLSIRPSGGARGALERLPEGVLEPQRWSVPGIEAVAVASNRLLGGVRAVGQVRDRDVPTAEPIACDVQWVTSGFFDVLGIPVLQGQLFDLSDRADVPVVVVNRALASQLWHGERALGRLIEGAQGSTPAEVAGVVADARYVTPWDPQRPTVYRRLSTTSRLAREILLRTSVPPHTILPQVERAWHAMSPDLRLSGRRAGADHVRLAMRRQRLTSQLLATFAAIALIVASIGLYSAMAWFVERRRREIAIRMAVGGSPVAIARRIVMRAGVVAAAGAVTGLAAALALAPHLTVLTRAASPYDAVAFGGAAAALTVVSLAAAGIPAARAARIDPAATLKSE
jgi:predicted permease